MHNNSIWIQRVVQEIVGVLHRRGKKGTCQTYKEETTQALLG